MKKYPPIAVVGMAGIFPAAQDIDRFWQNIINKANTVSRVPKGRWIIDPEAIYSHGYETDKACSLYAGLIQDFQ